MRFNVGLIISLFVYCGAVQAAGLNLYLWAGQIPNELVHQFTQETGISVNISSYDSNEIMYAKLKAAPNAGYDIVSPSTYFVQKLNHSQLLMPLNKHLIPNFKNLDKTFLDQDYDPGNRFSLPLQWGATGIFVNQRLRPDAKIQHWADLWQPRFKHQLALLDDVREVFAIGLLKCGYSPNDENPSHIKHAFHELKKLRKNIKLYNSNASVALMTDEDVTIGMTWNGFVAKANLENPSINFIYPKDGFALWIDNLAILSTAPHPEAAHAFINFMLRPDISARMMELEFFPVPNTAAIAKLPPQLRQNPILFPPPEILANGTILLDISPETMRILEQDWQRLRIS